MIIALSFFLLRGDYVYVSEAWYGIKGKGRIAEKLNKRD